jgi:hypothetical protein
LVDFRYHLVSIIAVFLALAIGIVLGTTALNSALVDDLRNQVKSLANSKRGLEHSVAATQGQLGDAQRFEKAAEGPLVLNRLSGRTVTVISAPGADRTIRDRLVKTLQTAGATVTLQIRLTARYSDPTHAADLDAAATAALPPPQTFTLGDSPMAHAAEALVSGAIATPHQPASRTVAVLEEFRTRGLLTTDGGATTPGSLALLLVPDPSGDSANDAVIESETGDLATALADRADATVVSGTLLSAFGGDLQAVRSNGALADKVSSCDLADQPQGRACSVLALAAGLHGQVGSWGSGRGTSGALPPVAAP